MGYIESKYKFKEKKVSEYTGNDKRLFMKYRLEGRKGPFFDFSEWKFLLGVRYSDICKLYLKENEKILNNKYKGSFKGTVFKRKIK